MHGDPRQFVELGKLVGERGKIEGDGAGSRNFIKELSVDEAKFHSLASALVMRENQRVREMLLDDNGLFSFVCDLEAPRSQGCARAHREAAMPLRKCFWRDTRQEHQVVNMAADGLLQESNRAKNLQQHSLHGAKAAKAKIF